MLLLYSVNLAHTPFRFEKVTQNNVLNFYLSLVFYQTKLDQVNLLNNSVSKQFQMSRFDPCNRYA